MLYQPKKQKHVTVLEEKASHKSREKIVLRAVTYFMDVTGSFIKHIRKCNNLSSENCIVSYKH